jgi:hypothetical protein
MPKVDLPWLLLYGVGFLPEFFDPQSRNIWTMDRGEEGHHCAEKGCGTLQRSCYVKLHVAFCCAVVDMGNGHSRFCGLRFGVTSPKGCSLHHYSEYDANHFFREAKKGLEYSLPPVYPQLQPGWEMVLQKLGNTRKPVTTRVGKYKTELWLERLIPAKHNGPIHFARLAKISRKEVLLAKLVVKNDDDETKTKPEMAQKPEQIRSLAELEDSNEEAYNNPFSYQSYNEFYATTAEANRRERKTARRINSEETA